MARTFTVAQLLDRMQRLCDWKNLDDDYSETGSYMSSGTLVQFLDQSHAEMYDVYTQADEGWNLTRATISLGGGSGSLPTDFGTMRAVQSSDGSGWRPLSRATLDDDTFGTSVWQGDASYRIIGDTIEVTQDASTLRITYTPSAPVLSSSLQTISGDSGFDQACVLRACIYGRIREEKSFGDLEDQLVQIKAQLREAASHRDRGTPAHTRDRRAGSALLRRRG